MTIKLKTAIAVAVVYALIVVGGMFILRKIAEARSVTYEAKITHPICDGLSDIKKYSCEAVEAEFGVLEWSSFDTLIKKESNWNHLAQNKNSTAFGLGQMLNSTWKTVGCEKTTDPYVQIDCTIKYVKKNYDTPHKAIVVHNTKNYY